MKQFLVKRKAAITGTIALLLVGGITMSFQDSPFSYNKYLVEENFEFPTGCSDTLPGSESNSMKMKDFDKLQSQLDGSLLEVTDQLKKIDLEKIKKEIDQSLKDVDIDQIKKNVELALKDIDMEKMMAGVKSSLKNLNKEYINADVEKALAEATKEVEKTKIEIKDLDKEVEKEMANARKEIEKSKFEIGKIDFDKIMNEARAGIDKAKEELRSVKEMFVEMEKDGLVDPKKGFTVEYKNKELYIDGKKQNEITTDKYRKYFKNDHFKMTIEKE